MNMKKNPNFIAAWLESENSLQKEYVCETFGIDPDRFFFIEHEREGAAEKVLDVAEAVLSTGAIDMFVINSLKAMVPSEEFKKSVGDSVVGAQARLNSRMMRKFTALIAEHETAFVVITHLTTDIGSMSRDPLIISGGYAIRYGASIILDLRKRAVLDTDPIKKEEGIKIHVSVLKNHCVPDRNPYVKTEYFAIFGQGIEQYLSTLDIALKQGILVQNGAFIKEVDANGEVKEWNGQKLQWQGREKFRDFVKENEDYFEYLKSRISGEVEQMSEEEIAKIKKDEEEIEKKMKK